MNGDSPKDYSRAAVERRWGPELMAEMERSVAEAPMPSDAELDGLRRLFAPLLKRIDAREHAARSEAA